MSTNCAIWSWFSSDVLGAGHRLLGSEPRRAIRFASSVLAHPGFARHGDVVELVGELGQALGGRRW